MREQEIKNRLKRAMDEAPINLLDDLLAAEVIKDTSPDGFSGRKMYVDSEPVKPKGIILQFPKINVLKTVALAAAIVFALLSGNTYYQNMTIGELYLDINPSFVVEVKRNEKVKEIRPLNYEAYDVLDGNYYNNANYEDALREILIKVEQKGYLLEDVNVLLVSSKERDNKEELSLVASQDIIAHFEGKREDVIVLRQNIDDRDDVVSGIENLLQAISNIDGIDLDTLHNMTLKELIIYLNTNDITLDKYVEVYGNTEILRESEPEPEIIEVPPTIEAPPPVIEPPADVTPEIVEEYYDDDYDWGDNDWENDDDDDDDDWDDNNWDNDDDDDDWNDDYDDDDKDDED